MDKLFDSSDQKTLEDILHRIGDAICMSDKNLVFKAANKNFAAFYGIASPSFLVGKSAFEVYPDFKKSVFYEACENTIKTGQPTSRIGFSANLKTWIVIRCYKYDEDNYVMVVHRLTEGLNKTGYVSQYDSLTSLPNRFLFEEEAKNLKEYKQNFGMTIFDIQHFNRLNDSLGFAVGDMCLMEVAARIKRNIPTSDRIYRLGGDQFLIMNTGKKEDSLVNIDKIKEAFNEPFNFAGKEYLINFNVGFAYIPSEENENEENSLKKVELALAYAKKHKVSYSEYNAEMNNIQHNVFLTKEIKDAIKNEELKVFLQPQADMIDGKICGAEVLVRWLSPTKGFLPPFAFLPFAEETGLIFDIDRYIIAHSLKAIKELEEKGINIPISINLSAQSLSDRTTPDYFKEQLEKYQVNIENVAVEITETSLMTDIKISIEVTQALRNLGIKVSIDDFGTGYSSMEYLVRYPSDFLKIDREFIKDISKSENHQIMVGNMIKLGHGLSIGIVAEGVETKEEWDLLKSMDCDVVQGFYYAKPMSLADFFKEVEIKGVASMHSTLI